MQTSSLQLTTHPDVYVERARNGWAIVRLNRPKSLHALDESLANALFEVFEQLRHDTQTQAIWLDSTTPKAFCAGGDVRKLREMVLSDQAEQADQSTDRFSLYFGQHLTISSVRLFGGFTRPNMLSKRDFPCPSPDNEYHDVSHSLLRYYSCLLLRWIPTGRTTSICCSC